MSKEKINELVIINRTKKLDQNFASLEVPFDIFTVAFRKTFKIERKLQFVRRSLQRRVKTLGLRYLWEMNFCYQMVDFISFEENSGLISINIDNLVTGLNGAYTKYKKRDREKNEKIIKLVHVFRTVATEDNNIQIINNTKWGDL